MKPPAPLSRREAEVLAHVAQGFSDKMTADRLQCSQRSVEKHRERLMRKLGIHGAALLTQYALAHSLIQNQFTK